MSGVITQNYRGPAVSVRPDSHLACHHGPSRKARQHCREAMQNGRVPEWAGEQFWLDVARLVAFGVTYD